uniref:Secreted protein n=1 Tax=Knipowitschia caucasica TaxID=637954 RepID=A0AAV2JXJ1_KNICA
MLAFPIHLLPLPLLHLYHIYPSSHIPQPLLHQAQVPSQKVLQTYPVLIQTLHEDLEAPVVQADLVVLVVQLDLLFRWVQSDQGHQDFLLLQAQVAQVGHSLLLDQKHQEIQLVLLHHLIQEFLLDLEVQSHQASHLAH